MTSRKSWTWPPIKKTGQTNIITGVVQGNSKTMHACIDIMQQDCGLCMWDTCLIISYQHGKSLITHKVLIYIYIAACNTRNLQVFSCLCSFGRLYRIQLIVGGDNHMMIS